MQRLAITEVEAIVGTPLPAVLMKQIDTLDEGCQRVLARSPLAGFGYRDEQGIPHGTFIGGRPGFVQVDSPKQVSLAATGELSPRLGGGVSFVFMLPGIGDTLRLNGTLTEHASGRLRVTVGEAFIHCPKCMLRSGLWKPPRPRHAASILAPGDGVLSPRPIADFLAASPFAIVSTWDASDASDTSPRGDPPGFIRVLDPSTIALPDRKGNQRIDTFHNLLEDDRIALAAIVPGRQEVLQLHGRGWISNDPALLASMALKGQAPELALCVRVLDAQLVANEPLRAARPWHASSHVSRNELPDFIALGARHLAQNKDKGLKAAVFRGIARVLGAFPASARRLIEGALRRDLANEGYDATGAGLGARRVRVAEIRRETPDAVTLLLEDGGPFEFRAGQYFTLCVPIDGQTVRRAYSASSLPGEGQLALTVKRIPGGRCSTFINERLHAGATLELIGPSGTFAVDPDASLRRELVLLAGGSGITPLVSIARSVLASEPHSRISLLYGNRTRADIIFADALEQLRATHAERVQLRHVLQDPPQDWHGGRGLLDAATLRSELLRLAPAADAQYFVCGPAPMLEGARGALGTLGIDASQIHEERFTPPRTGMASKGARRRLEMLVQRSGQPLGTAEVAVGKTLLEAGLDAGLPLPFSCAMGNCGECRVRLVCGEVALDEPNSLAPHERAQGYVLACVARPLSPTTIEIEAELELE